MALPRDVDPLPARACSGPSEAEVLSLHSECCLRALLPGPRPEPRFLGLTAPLQHACLVWGTLCSHLTATQNSFPRPHDTPLPLTKNPCVPGAPPANTHTAASAASAAPCPERGGPGALLAPAQSTLGRLLSPWHSIFYKNFLVYLSQTDHMPGSRTSNALHGTQAGSPREKQEP